MERYPEAESILRQAVGLDPDLAQAHFNLGGLRYIRGNYPGAITEYKRVIELNPAHIDAWRMLTWSYYRSGEMVKAREAYDSAIHLRPTLRELLPDLRTTPEVAL
jgi:tetratricopeptide (TPR) repeat protein